MRARWRRKGHERRRARDAHFRFQCAGCLPRRGYPCSVAARRHHRYIFEEKETRDAKAKTADKKKKAVIARLQVGAGMNSEGHLGGSWQSTCAA